MPRQLSTYKARRADVSLLNLDQAKEEPQKECKGHLMTADLPLAPEQLLCPDAKARMYYFT